MSTIAEKLQASMQALSEVSDSPRLDAEVLLAHVLKVQRSHFYAWPKQVLTATELSQYDALLNRRLQGEPIAYLLGYREFWSLPLAVSPATLIPRPETELLVSEVLARLPKDEPLTVADLGTGSGAIALAIASERPNWQIIAIDRSPEALAIADKNAHDLRLTNVSFQLGNWLTARPSFKFDAIVSNPPYIAEAEWPEYADQLRFEPKEALVAADEGLADIKQIIVAARQFLKLDGWLMLEHGFNQGQVVRSIALQNGYQNVHSICDLAGHERIMIAKSSNS